MTTETKYDPLAHVRELQALFRAENKHAIELAEKGEKLAEEYQRLKRALMLIEERCDRPSTIWNIAADALGIGGAPSEIEVQPDGSILSVPLGTAINAKPCVMTMDQLEGHTGP